MANPQAGDWDRFWSLDQSQKFGRISWSKKRILNVLSRYIRPGQKALDAGCGSGFFSAFFCAQGLETWALDYSTAALEMAKKATAGKAKLVQADLVGQDLKQSLPQTFDIIFTDGLFEHFSDGDQDNIISNLSALLSPGGYLVTFVPNLFSPWELIRPLFMPGIEEKPFMLKGLKNLNEQNGLKVLEAGGVNVLPFGVSPEFLGPVFGMLLYTVAQVKIHGK